MRARFLPTAPVTCAECASDAFALGGPGRTDPRTGRIHVELRCGACGLWQDRDLSAREAERFREHLDLTQRQIARVLAAMLRAAATAEDR